MTAKDEANKIYLKFFNKFNGVGMGVDWNDWAKECAIIAMVEVKNALEGNTGYTQCVIDIEKVEEVIILLKNME